MDILCGKIGFDIEARDVIGMYGGNIVAETKIIDIGKTLRELLDPLLCRIWKAIIVYDDQGSVWRRESSPYQNIDQRMERRTRWYFELIIWLEDPDLMAGVIEYEEDDGTEEDDESF